MQYSENVNILFFRCLGAEGSNDLKLPTAISPTSSRPFVEFWDSLRVSSPNYHASTVPAPYGLGVGSGLIRAQFNITS